MRIDPIDHVSINVKDFDASVAFYGGVLGFRRLQTVPMDPDPPGTSAGFRIAYFEVCQKL